MAEAEGDILTLDEVAAYLKAGKRTIYRLAASREMPAASESVFMIFSWGTLLRKSGRGKAQTAAGLVARRGFATPQILFLRSNPTTRNRVVRCSGVRRSKARARASTGENGQKKPTESGWFFK